MPLLQCNGTQLFYDTLGEHGDTVLMIQGVGVVGEGWFCQREELAKHHRVIWFDNRGIGQSAPLDTKLSMELMAQDNFALLDGLGIEKAHVIGHSMGGVVAQEMAFQQPERLLSLTLASTLSKGSHITKMPPKKLWLSIKSFLGTKRSRRQAFIDMAFTEEWQAGRSTEELHNLLSPMFGRDLATQPPILTKQIMAARRHNRFAQLPQLTMPTLVIHGEKDVIAPVQEAHALHKQIPHSTLQVFKERGHGVMVEDAEGFNRTLLAHFQKAVFVDER